MKATETANLRDRLSQLGYCPDMDAFCEQALSLENNLLTLMKRAVAERTHGEATSYHEMWKEVCAEAARIQNDSELSARSIAKTFSLVWPRLLATWQRVFPAFASVLQQHVPPSEADAAARNMVKDDPIAAIFTQTGKVGRFPIAFDGAPGVISWIESQCFLGGAFKHGQHLFYQTAVMDDFDEGVGDAWESIRAGLPPHSPDICMVWWFIQPPTLGITGRSASAAFAKAFGHLAAGQRVDPRVLVMAEIAGADPSMPLKPVDGIQAKVTAAVANNQAYLKQAPLDQRKSKEDQEGADPELAADRIPSCIDRIALLPETTGAGLTNLEEARVTLRALQNDKTTAEAAHMIDLYDLEAGRSVDI